MDRTVVVMVRVVISGRHQTQDHILALSPVGPTLIQWDAYVHEPFAPRAYGI